METINVIYVEPGKEARTIEMKDELSEMQNLVGGLIEEYMPFEDNVAIIKDQFEQKVYINPVDAAERGIQNGDLVYVYNDRGCTKIRAEVTHYIVPGVISVEHGSWYRASKDPNETFTAYLKQGFDGVAQAYPNTPIDVGGCENLLTDDTFVYDVIYVNQTAGLHGGPVEVSLTKPE